MKILFDYKIFCLQSLGGISKYIIKLAENLNAENAKASISCKYHFNKYLNQSRFSKGKIYLTKFPKFTRRFFRFTNNLFYNIELYKTEPDIIHNTYYSSINKYKKNQLIALTVYDLIHEIFHDNYGYQKNYLPKINAIKNTDIIFTISHNTKKDLIERYKVAEKNIFVTHLGVDQNVNRILSKDRIIKQDYILFVGDRKRYKNFNNFITGFSFSDYLKSNFKICLVGGEVFSKNEIMLIDQLRLKNNLIHYYPSETELKNLYQFATCFVFPSKYEGFGLPSLEAMANGCPVVSSDTSIMKEICGSASEMFDADSPESIMYSMESVVNSKDRRDELIKKGYHRIKNFSWEACAKKTIEVYKKHINN